MFEGLEVVFEVLGLAFGVIEGDVVSEGAVDVEGGCFFFVDGEHDVRRR